MKFTWHLHLHSCTCHQVLFLFHPQIRYFPHNGSSETLPSRSYVKDSLSAGSASEDADDIPTQASALTQGPAQAPTSSASSSGSMTVAAERTLDVFWCHRLVPDSGLDSLPFWPSTKWENANLDKVGSHWRQRLHGSLFFPWHFPISNNKLKLLACHEGSGNGGLADVLADEKLVRTYDLTEV